MRWLPCQLSICEAKLILCGFRSYHAIELIHLLKQGRQNFDMPCLKMCIEKMELATVLYGVSVTVQLTAGSLGTSTDFILAYKQYPIT